MKSQEAYVKYSLGRQMANLCCVMDGYTRYCYRIDFDRNIYHTANYLFNENSKFCVLPDKYRQLHKLLDKDGDGKISEKEVTMP